MTDLKHILSKFSTIQLNQMDKVRLMKRVDQKYLMSYDQLLQLLPLIKDDYSCLAIDNLRSFNYVTKYYDSPKLLMYYDHHNGKLNRFKIRFRDYEYIENSFLEIKIRTNKGIVIKERKEVGYKNHNLTQNNLKFINDNLPYDLKPLDVKLANNFKRITLVNLEQNERVTIDTNIVFSNSDFQIELPHLVVVELKQEKQNLNASIAQIFKENRISSTSFSKYAIGMALTHNGVKKNKFKQKINYINTI
ncbi:MAG: polyphosphate polymerase domain-containing protein [Flavobacteriaceae bacterium]